MKSLQQKRDELADKYEDKNIMWIGAGQSFKAGFDAASAEYEELVKGLVEVLKAICKRHEMYGDVAFCKVKFIGEWMDNHDMRRCGDEP